MKFRKLIVDSRFLTLCCGSTIPSIYRHSLGDCGSSQLYLSVCLCVCVSVCLCVCLSRFYGLYLGYYELDFDQTWWECWNFGPIDCVKI